jgi:hypothetical protein
VNAPLKAYYYKEQELGFPNGFPSGTLRLNEVEEIQDPSAADIFIIPPSLMHVQDPNVFKRIPYLLGNEVRHVAFDVSDYEQTYSLPCLFIRCNVRKWMLEKDPNSISLAWPVDDFGIQSPSDGIPESVSIPPRGLEKDLSFHAWLSSDCRKKAAQSCIDKFGLFHDMGLYRDFTGYVYYKEEGIRRRKEFRRSMQECKTALCPESIPGVFPYRFFEAMSSARVGILFCSGYVLPFEEEIPWDEVCVRFESDQAKDAGTLIHDWIKKMSIEKIIEMGRKAREYWLKFLNREDWNKTTFTYMVTKKLRQLGVERRAGGPI